MQIDSYVWKNGHFVSYAWKNEKWVSYIFKNIYLAPTHVKSKFSWKVAKILENQENLDIPRISFHFFWFSKNFLEKQDIFPIKGCVKLIF